MFSGPVSPLLDFRDDAVPRAFAGSWARILAFVVDIFIVCIPCFVLGSVFYSYFSVNPVAGTLVGFAITLPYFAVMGSRFGDGQTLGQRLTHIQVIREDGSMVPLQTSVLRYLILTADLLPRVPSRVTSLFNVLLIGTEFAIVYLFVFNRPTRQSLHDLATKTFVVKLPGLGRINAPRFWPWHWAILTGIALASAVAVEITVPRLVMTPTVSELNSIRINVTSLPDVSSADVVLRNSSSGGQQTTAILVNVRCRQKPADYEGTARQIAAMIIKTDPHAKQVDFITVNFLEGFEVGLARFTRTTPFKHSPEDWMQMSENIQ